MIRQPFAGDRALTCELADRRAAIELAERTSRAIAKASEQHLPADERRQVLLPASDRADALAVGGTVEHATGPTFQQRAQVALVLALGLPAVVGLAYVTAHALLAGACSFVNS